MTGVLCVLGVDPGPTTGLAIAYWDEESWMYPGAYQCDASSAPALAGWLASLHGSATRPAVRAVRGQVEEFRPGTGAGARGANAAVTRTAVDELKAVLESYKVTVATRPAATVKPWATDERLKKAGLFPVTAGMPMHARDAFRHLLYRAVRDCGVPDPLSTRRKP